MPAKGHYLSEEAKRKVSAARKGKPLSKEHRLKLSAAHKGKPLSREHALHIGQALKGHKRGWNQKGMLGKHHSAETRKRISEKKKGTKHTPEAIVKIIAGHTGLRHSDISKQKMRGAKRKRDLQPFLSPEEDALWREAKARGSRHYQSKRPCIYGHDGWRTVKGYYCKGCKIRATSKRLAIRRLTEPEFRMYTSARQRAKDRRVPFTLSLADIKAAIPSDGLCPVLGMPLEFGLHSHTRHSPSLDRIQPKLGYTIGNVAVISRLANIVKNDEYDFRVFERIADWLINKEYLYVMGGNTTIQLTQLRQMLRAAKFRAKQRSIDFTLDVDYLRGIWPESNRCPLLGTVFAKNTTYAASLDRIVPDNGYVKGNVAIISKKANTIKQDVTNPDVFRQVADWLRRMELISVA